MVDIYTVGIGPVPKMVGGGNVSPGAFRRRVVRYWHPLGCRAIELGRPPREGVMYTVVPYDSVVVVPGLQSSAWSSNRCTPRTNTNRYDEYRTNPFVE